MRDKVIPPATHHVGLVSETVSPVRQQDQVEIFVGLDQRVYDEQGAVVRDVVVEGTVGEQQFALQILREVLVRLAVVAIRLVVVTDQETLPLLSPVVLVDAVVVVACLGNADLEEIGTLVSGTRCDSRRQLIDEQ